MINIFKVYEADRVNRLEDHEDNSDSTSENKLQQKIIGAISNLY